ncbi:MAG: hypothetical protein ACR2PL_12690 [Dehalococcoidia bacterium]
MTFPSTLLKASPIITRLFGIFCSNFALQITESGFDKHGSLVWEGVGQDVLNRYVSLGVTVGGGNGWSGEEAFPSGGYDFSVASGADNGQRFIKAYEHSWHYDTGEEFELGIEPPRNVRVLRSYASRERYFDTSKEFLGTVMVALLEASDSALEVDESRLHEDDAPAYISPRRFPFNPEHLGHDIRR